MWFCTECGASSPKWEGKCPSCGAWNTMVEEKVAATPSPLSGSGAGRPKSTPRPVNQIEAVDEPRFHMPSEELNRVLGGGLVKGSIILIGGEPGIGKSTLVLQNLLAIRNRRILYVSGEESATQLKLRADRIGRGSDNLFIVCETWLENIFSHIEDVKPEIVVVDSIQTIASDTLDSSAGSCRTPQIRKRKRRSGNSHRTHQQRRQPCRAQGSRAYRRRRTSVRRRQPVCLPAAACHQKPVREHIRNRNL